VAKISDFDHKATAAAAARAAARPALQVISCVELIKQRVRRRDIRRRRSDKF